MDARHRVEALVAPLRADVVSGSVAVVGAAAKILRRAADTVPATTIGELTSQLEAVGRAVLDAQPAMASLALLVGEFFAALAEAGTLAEARLAASAAAQRFSTEIEARSGEVAVRALDIVPTLGGVATISSSSCVRATLVNACRGPNLHVVCFESRPAGEGRVLAATLAHAGIPVIFAVDAAVESLVGLCDVVLLGADSIGDRGVVNKIGSASLARAAATAQVPTYVLADESKLLPVGFPQRVDDDRPGQEVWRAPPGVRVWNRYFETVPWEHVTGVVTEAGIFAPAQLVDRRSRVEFPAVLQRWTEGT